MAGAAGRRRGDGGAARLRVRPQPAGDRRRDRVRWSTPARAPAACGRRAAPRPGRVWTRSPAASSPSAGWDDLVLPDAELALLRHIVDQVRGRGQVLRSWGLGRADHPRQRGDGAVRRRLGHGQDARRRGDRPRAGARHVPDRPGGRGQQVHRRDRAEPAARVRRGRGGRGAADVRRGRRAVRQAQRGQGQPRPLRQYRGQLPAGADGGLPRGGDPGHQPAPCPRRRVPAAAALHRHLPVPRRRPSGPGCGRARSRPRRRSPSWTSSAWPSWPRAAG